MDKTRKFHFASFEEREIHFLSDVYSEGNLVAQRIKSKLLLNEIKYVRPLMFLYPMKEKKEDINHLFEVEIKGYFEYLDGEKAGEIHIPKAYVGDSECTSFASSWEECVIEIIPDEIYQKHYLNYQSQEIPKKAWVIFSLTENKMIRPWGTMELSFTGDVKSEFKPRVTLNFEDGWIGIFENHYKHIKTKLEETGGHFSSSRLVLNLKKEDYSLPSIKEIETKSELVNNLLLYISFGSRQKTIGLLGPPESELNM